jgi:hypothetical protein
LDNKNPQKVRKNPEKVRAWSMGWLYCYYFQTLLPYVVKRGKFKCNFFFKKLDIFKKKIRYFLIRNYIDAYKPTANIIYEQDIIKYINTQNKKLQKFTKKSGKIRAWSMEWLYCYYFQTLLPYVVDRSKFKCNFFSKN